MIKSKLVNRRALAATLSVHVDTISDWIDHGLPVARRGGRGTAHAFDLAAVKTWLTQRSATMSADAAELVKQRARREAAGAQLAEQAYAMRERILIPQDEVDRAWADHVSAVRTFLLAAPDHWLDAILRAYEVSGRSAAYNVLKTQVRDALRALGTMAVDADGITPPTWPGDSTPPASIQ
jgi:hypothetical protein